MFAKLFERDGHQVLVTKEQDEKEPVLKLRFKSVKSGHDISMKFSFKPDSTLDAEGVLDRAFDLIDEDGAFDLRSGSPGLEM